MMHRLSLAVTEATLNRLKLAVADAEGSGELADWAGVELPGILDRASSRTAFLAALMNDQVSFDWDGEGLKLSLDGQVHHITEERPTEQDSLMPANSHEMLVSWIKFVNDMRRALRTSGHVDEITTRYIAEESKNIVRAIFVSGSKETLKMLQAALEGMSP